MKIYTLIKTRDDNFHCPEIEHFNKLEEAQSEMINKCNKLVGQKVCHIGQEITTTNNGWEIEIGENWATLFDGERFDFNIIEKEFNT